MKQATFNIFLKNPNKWAPTCPNRSEKMTFMHYEKGPPKENEVSGCKLTDWDHQILEPWLQLISARWVLSCASVAHEIPVSI